MRAIRRRSSRTVESVIEYLILGCACISIMILLLIFIFLFKEGLPAFAHIPLSEFIFGTVWQVQAVEPRYGILPLLCGSILVTGGAITVSVPLSLMCALYISEVAHPLVREVIKPLIELLAGIPSVVYGFLALTVLADLTQRFTGSIHRLNALNGALILAVMIAPTVISISEDAIKSVPKEYREAAYAIGADKWETMSKIVFPAALPGVLVAVMLGISRAIGETMAVLMATGNAPLFTFDILSSVQTMTAVIAIEMGEVTFGSIHYHALFAVGLVLLGITFIINFLAEVLLRRFRSVRF
ncbi:MAG: phosphate ABC transporter permease subunit PstC [Candidatus Bathyarchaeia archaeon]|nr:phosphate ABC transporter permease subunit PstC [Candidatus Bathyarchaeota archaeon]